MLAESSGTRPATRLLRARQGLVGFGLGSIPAIITLAVRAGVVPQVVNLQIEAIADFLFFISYPIAGVLLKIGWKPATIGFLLGVAFTTCLLVFSWIVAGAASVAAGGY